MYLIVTNNFFSNIQFIYRTLFLAGIRMPMLLFSRTSINFYKFKIIIIIATVKIIFELLTTKVVVPIYPLKNES